MSDWDFWLRVCARGLCLFGRAVVALGVEEHFVGLDERVVCLGYWTLCLGYWTLWGYLEATA